MPIRLIICMLLCAIPFMAAAQVSQPIPSQNSRFEFPESIVCASYGSGGEIIITTTSLECPLGGDPCAIDFDYDPVEGFGKKEGPTAGTFVDDNENLRIFTDGIPISFAYMTEGTYTVAVLIGAGPGNFDQLTAPVTVLPSTTPSFEIYNCMLNEVQVEITDTNFPSYSIDYDQDNVTDAQSPPGMVATTHTYPPAQTQALITITPDYESCASNTKSVQLINGGFSNNHLISQLEVQEADEIELLFNGIENNILYSLERSTNGPSSFDQVDQFSAQSAYLDPSVDPDQNFYCYRLGARDVCNNLTYYGNTICSHRVGLTVGDGVIDFNWTTTLPGAGALILAKNTDFINPGFTSTGLYSDNALVCGSEYCYRLVTDYGGSINSISRTLCGTARTTQPPVAITEITSTVSEGSVLLQWQENPLFSPESYDIFRRPGNTGIPLTKVSEPAFTDDGYEPFGDVCYQIQYRDACNNRSDRSQEVCPINLKATLNNEDNSVLLEWNAYAGWSSGVDRYVLEKYDGEGQLVASVDQQTNTTYTDADYAPGQVFTYRIVAIPSSPANTQPSVSNTQTIIKSPKLYHPTAFVPGSAIAENRTFAVKGVPEYVAAYELRIFNRWGEMVFFTDDMTLGWDGTFKGVTMPEGTYAFKAQVIDTAGRTFDYAGAFVLLRKSQ